MARFVLVCCVGLAAMSCSRPTTIAPTLVECQTFLKKVEKASQADDIDGMLDLLDADTTVVIKYTHPSPSIEHYTKQEYRELIERMDEDLVEYHYDQDVDEGTFHSGMGQSTLQTRVIQKAITSERTIEYGSTYTWTLVKDSEGIRISRIEMSHDQELIQDSKIP